MKDKYRIDLVIVMYHETKSITVLVVDSLMQDADNPNEALMCLEDPVIRQEVLSKHTRSIELALSKLPDGVVDVLPSGEPTLIRAKHQNYLK